MSQNNPVAVHKSRSVIPQISLCISFALTLTLPSVAQSAPYGRSASVSSSTGTIAGNLQIWFLDVGQGDAIYMELPDGSNVLVDGGPSKSATSTLAKFLRSKKVARIDHVVLTHPHADHYNGLFYVLSNLSIGAFYDTRMDNTGAKGDNNFRKRVSKSGVPIYYPSTGDALNWGASTVNVKILNGCPEPNTSSMGEVINNCSIVFKIRYRGVAVLLTGDVQDNAERRMLAAYGDELRADVIKVPHHGSQYSSGDAFLRTVSPKHAFIQVGKNNKYGLPTKQVLDRLMRVGAKVSRTDTDGTQLFTINP